jgi:hypothetical protein
MNNILRQGNRHGRPLQITLLSSVYSRFREKLKNYANKNCNVSIVLEEDDFTIKSPSPASESELNYVESILKQLERLENVDNYKLDVGEKKESLESILSKETISKHEVDDLIRYTKSRYVESILVFDDIWFYVTSIEIYLHYTPKVDDCTDDRTMDVVDRPKAYLHRKGKHYTFYFELSIYVGKIEFLVCGGFFGCFNDSNNKITPFLGTSIHKLPDNIKNTLNDRECKRIYIQFPGPKTTEHPRILQQYYKEDSNKIWRITSSFYYERAFNISNPLELVSLNKHHLKGSITPVLARFVLNCYSYKTVDTRMLQKLLSLLKKNKNKAEILGRIDWTDIKNWKEANDTANKSVGKKKPKPIMLINIISQLEDNRTREGFFVCDKCVLRKKEALWIFKDLVYKTLKKEKEKTIENYRI